tara:strand:+ start:3536 stop:3709 length:174 start_codon:yes stop_codon:yes gene_type:complete
MALCGLAVNAGPSTPAKRNVDLGSGGAQIDARKPGSAAILRVRAKFTARETPGNDKT